MIQIEENVNPIRQDYLSGMSFASIGEKYMIDPRTAKRYALKNLPLEYLDNRPFSSVLDPFKEQIDKWLLNGRIFASTIHDRLIEQGCECGYTIVNDYVRRKIEEYEKAGIYETCMPVNRKKVKLRQCEKVVEEKRILTQRSERKNDYGR